MNSLQFGFRGREYPVRKPKGVFRILLIGDSMVFGHGVAPDQTISAHMERLLNQRSDSTFYHVINASRPGYSLMDTSILYQQTAHKFNADTVVVVLSNNDAEVVGTPHSDQYGEHCRQIWQPDSPSFPFFQNAFLSFKKNPQAPPLLVAYYGLANDHVADLASSVLADLCQQQNIPFINLQKLVTWIPLHRAVASKADAHPSGHVHKIAATELCKKLRKEQYLPATDHHLPHGKPDIDLQGVSKEWAAEELRAWCASRQDGKGKESARQLIQSKWPQLAEDTYRQRQIRIMDKWWGKIQDDRAFDWRYYKEHFLNIRKGLLILERNNQTGQESFLDSDAFFRDPFPTLTSSLAETKEILQQIQTLGPNSPGFLDAWLPHALWAYDELTILQNTLKDMVVPPALAETKQRLTYRFNNACNAFFYGISLFCWEEYMQGFANLPVRLTDKPLIEVRLCIQATENGYLNILCKGQGDIPSFLHDGLYIHGEKAPQYLLFMFPLTDLFSCETRLRGPEAKYLHLEYRVNKGNWRALEFTDPLQRHTDTTFHTPLRPAFC